MVRGGGWSSSLGTLRSAIHSNGTTGHSNDSAGFRIARTLTP